MTVIFNYERKGIFNNKDLASDEKKNASFADIKIALKALKKSTGWCDCVHIADDNGKTYCLSFDSWEEKENGIVTIILYYGLNRDTPVKMSLSVVQKKINDAAKKAA